MAMPRGETGEGTAYLGAGATVTVAASLTLQMHCDTAHHMRSCTPKWRPVILP